MLLLEQRFQLLIGYFKSVDSGLQLLHQFLVFSAILQHSLAYFLNNPPAALSLELQPALPNLGISLAHHSVVICHSQHIKLQSFILRPPISF